MALIDAGRTIDSVRLFHGRSREPDTLVTFVSWPHVGFTPAAMAELTVKSTLITTIGDTIRECGLTQQDAAKLCGTDQLTLSKALRSRMESVTIDKLAA